MGNVKSVFTTPRANVKSVGVTPSANWKKWYNVDSTSTSSAPDIGVIIANVAPGYAAVSSTAYPTSSAVSSGVIYLFIPYESVGVTSVADDAGNTYNLLSFEQRSGWGGSTYAAVVTSTLGSGQNITVTWASASNSIRGIFAFTILNTTGRDATAVVHSNTDSTDITVTSTPTSSPTILILAATSTNVALQTGVTNTYGTSWNNYNNAGNNNYCTIFYTKVPGVTSTKIGVDVSSSIGHSVQGAYFK